MGARTAEHEIVFGEKRSVQIRERFLKDPIGDMDVVDVYVDGQKSELALSLGARLVPWLIVPKIDKVDTKRLSHYQKLSLARERGLKVTKVVTSSRPVNGEDPNVA